MKTILILLSCASLVQASLADSNREMLKLVGEASLKALGKMSKDEMEEAGWMIEYYEDLLDYTGDFCDLEIVEKYGEEAQRMHKVMCDALNNAALPDHFKGRSLSEESVITYRKYCPPLFWKYYIIVDYRPDVSAFLINEYFKSLSYGDLSKLDLELSKQLLNFVFSNHPKFSDEAMISFIEFYSTKLLVRHGEADEQVIELIRSIFLSRNAVIRPYALEAAQRAFELNEGNVLKSLSSAEITKIESLLVENLGSDWNQLKLKDNRRLMEKVFRESDWENFGALDLFLMVLLTSANDPKPL